MQLANSPPLTEKSTEKFSTDKGMGLAAALFFLAWGCGALFHEGGGGQQLAVSESTSPNPSNIGQEVTFTDNATGGTGVYTEYDWYFGDGTSTASTTTNQATHSYSAAGSYQTYSVVHDSSGATATSNKITQVVNPTGNLSGSLTSSPNNPCIGATVTFTASFSGGKPPYTYAFNFGDGSQIYNTIYPTAMHAYAKASTFNASVNVKDSSSPQEQGNATDSVIVTNCSTGTNLWSCFEAAVANGLVPQNIPEQKLHVHLVDFDQSPGHPYCPDKLESSTDENVVYSWIKTFDMTLKAKNPKTDVFLWRLVSSTTGHPFEPHFKLPGGMELCDFVKKLMSNVTKKITYRMVAGDYGTTLAEHAAFEKELNNVITGIAPAKWWGIALDLWEEYVIAHPSDAISLLKLIKSKGLYRNVNSAGTHNWIPTFIKEPGWQKGLIDSIDFGAGDFPAWSNKGLQAHIKEALAIGCSDALLLIDYPDPIKGFQGGHDLSTDTTEKEGDKALAEVYHAVKGQKPTAMFIMPTTIQPLGVEYDARLIKTSGCGGG